MLQLLVPYRKGFFECRRSSPATLAPTFETTAPIAFKKSDLLLSYGLCLFWTIPLVPVITSEFLIHFLSVELSFQGNISARCSLIEPPLVSIAPVDTWSYSECLSISISLLYCYLPVYFITHQSIVDRLFKSSRRRIPKIGIPSGSFLCSISGVRNRGENPKIKSRMDINSTP